MPLQPTSSLRLFNCLRKFVPSRSTYWAFVALSLLGPTTSWGQTTAGSGGLPIDFSGDIRLRYERDWDSQNASGAPRQDRNRGRLRARVSAQYAIDADWSAGVRIRTGNTSSQQSPHLTFSADNGGTDDLEGLFDKYYLRYKNGDQSFWIGRNSFPFWQQNEFFWDDDVTPTGVAASFESSVGTGKMTTTLGAFKLPDGGNGLNGSLLSGQLKYSAPTANGQLTLAAGLHSFSGENGAKNLRNRNGDRDYLIGVLGAQWTTPVEDRPLALGLDLFHNFENYTASDAAPLSANQADETSGYVFSAKYGQLKNAGEWQVGYYYAHIETFAVNSSFAQDDWVRFGSATQTDGSDCAGHEARVSYALSKQLNLVARLFIVEAITSQQDGKRFRVDLNWKF